jgi:hypothetical protein
VSLFILDPKERDVLAAVAVVVVSVANYPEVCARFRLIKCMSKPMTSMEGMGFEPMTTCV